MKCLLILFVLLNTGCLYGQALSEYKNQLKNHNQVLFVKTRSNTSIYGTMILYERINQNTFWKAIDSFPIVVGEKGLGKDAQTTIVDKILAPKKEGDGKSPAGIFPLGSVFSYHKMRKIKMPFVQVDTNFYCVDDARSIYYNTLVHADTAKKPFNSFEYMKRRDNQYEYGVWVLYNSAPVVAGNGSCIFLHVWSNNHTGTSGCTAMSKMNILKLINWLDERKMPVMLQVPRI